MGRASPNENTVRVLNFYAEKFQTKILSGFIEQMRRY